MKQNSNGSLKDLTNNNKFSLQADHSFKKRSERENKSNSFLPTTLSIETMSIYIFASERNLICRFAIVLN